MFVCVCNCVHVYLYSWFCQLHMYGELSVGEGVPKRVRMWCGVGWLWVSSYLDGYVCRICLYETRCLKLYLVMCVCMYIYLYNWS